MRQKGFTPILIAILLLVSLVLYLGYKRMNSTPPAVSFNTLKNGSEDVDNNKVYTDPISKIYTNYKHYENNVAGFEIEYPGNLVHQTFTFSDNRGGKIDLFCQFQQNLNNFDLSNGTPNCKDGGFEIWYTQTPGWGGGCDEKFHKSANFLGNKYDYCDFDNSFNQIYANNNITGFEFNISGIYGDKISKTDTFKSLSTFKLIK